jgi:hypothetical protein
MRTFEFDDSSLNIQNLEMKEKFYRLDDKHNLFEFDVRLRFSDSMQGEGDMNILGILNIENSFFRKETTDSEEAGALFGFSLSAGQSTHRFFSKVEEEIDKWVKIL